ncbi:MAG: hypothetical protein LBF85_04290 [Tannerella sp.]|jgi:hypothetical protein|nr:hypothetical protein [Tannerella sp.]
MSVKFKKVGRKVLNGDEKGVIRYTSRSESGNLWLREIDARCERPSEEKTCDSEVCFLDYRTLRKKEEIWQAVDLSTRVGNMYSIIKVAQQFY